MPGSPLLWTKFSCTVVEVAGCLVPEARVSLLKLQTSNPQTNEQPMKCKTIELVRVPGAKQEFQGHMQRGAGVFHEQRKRSLIFFLGSREGTGFRKDRNGYLRHPRLEEQAQLHRGGSGGAAKA